MNTQLCKKCNKEKPLTEEYFKKTKLLSTGFYKTCKPCCAQYSPNYGRNAQMKSRYGLTPEQYDEKLKSQGGVCILCGSDPTIQERRFSVDHDHECCSGQKSCGKCLRGILCADCNRRIGFLEELLKEGSVSPLLETWLHKAVRYLTQYSKGAV